MEERVCRVCQAAEPAEELLEPCRCSGSVRWIHRSCLNNWRRHCRASSPSGALQCELCGSLYVYEFCRLAPRRAAYMIMTEAAVCCLPIFLIFLAIAAAVDLVVGLVTSMGLLGLLACGDLVAALNGWGLLYSAVLGLRGQERHRFPGFWPTGLSKMEWLPGSRWLLYLVPVIMPNLMTWMLFAVRDWLGQDSFEELGLMLAKLGSWYLMLLVSLRVAGAWLKPPLVVVRDSEGWPMLRSLTPQVWEQLLEAQQQSHSSPFKSQRRGGPRRCPVVGRVPTSYVYSCSPGVFLISTTGSGIGIDPNLAHSAMETKLSSFLHRAEWALLSLEPGSLGPKVDPELRGPEGFDCTALQKLLEPTRGGELVTVLSDPWLEELSKVLSRQAVDAALAAGGLHRLVLDLTSASMSFLDAPSGSRPVRERALYMLGVVFLQHYMRANCTGPAKNEDDACLPFHPSASIEEGTPSAILGALEADGEPCYELLVCPGYLWLSALMFRLVPSEMPKFDGAALPFWRARCAFAWQLSLAEASERGCGQSPSLFRASVYELVSGEASPLSTKGFLEASALSAIQAATAPLLDTWKRSTERPPAVTPTVLPKAQESETEVEGSDALEALLDVFEPPARAPASAEVPGAVRATVLVELANRLCWYSRLKIWEKSSDAACKAIGFHYELTGVMGIKREFQTTEFAQLVVRAKSQAAGKGIEVEESDAKKPETLSLKTVDDMTDVLEVPKLSKSVDEEVRLEIERPLTVTEQIILLSRCQYIWASSNPNDEMVLQEINALAQRVVKTQDKAREEEANEGPLFTANWLTFSCGLWYRCRAEHHRNKTRERAAFQLQSLVDQFADERPSAAHRLRTVHSAGYPARFHLQHEMATRMMRMGMMSTAHEQFKKLRMWPEAVECLICAERNVEAEDMVKDLIEKQPSPRLWCCLGDIVKDPAHYEKAWELSNRRFARAQRALGKYYFDKKQLDKAVESFKLALDINPMFEGIWFTLGVGLMQLERMEEAMIAFSRVLSINDEDGQAWANLAAVHLHQDRVKCRVLVQNLATDSLLIRVNMPWFYSLFLAAGAVTAAATASATAATCLNAQAYGSAEQRGEPFSKNVQDAETCQSSCASSNNCRYFTYDTSTADCWLLDQVLFLQIDESAISGTVDCILQQHDEDTRSEHVMGGLKRAAEFVYDRTTDDQVRKDAKHVKWSCENGFLEEESYGSVRRVMMELSNLVSAPAGLEEAASHGAILTTDDVHWLTSHMKGEDVMSLHLGHLADYEDAETGASNSACENANIGCDEGGSFGAGTPWTNAIVKFCFDIHIAPSAREALTCAMQKVSSHLPGIVFQNVQYTGVDTCGQSPAIFMQSNGRRSGHGCWADIGMSTSLFGGNQKLNIQTPGCDNCGTATHELLHGLGMAHEQARSDRDRYVTILWNNIKPGMDNQFTKNSKADTNRPYDLMSIMHYGSRSFSKNGRDTMIVKPAAYHVYTTDPSQYQFYRIGQRMGMSTQDVSQLSDLYGCDDFSRCKPVRGGGNFLADVFSPAGMSSGSGLIIVIVVALVVLLGGCAVFFCFCGGSRQAKAVRPYQRMGP
ncbi:ttc27 [Symbiodinium microadriaticum]|nr:ttc27 [Symbiodinium microadriaticum]